MGHYANTDGLTEAFTVFIQEWGLLLNVGLGIATLTGLLAFGWALTQLNMQSDNPKGRQEAISKLMLVAFTTALTGGFWTFVGIFYLMFV